MIPNILTLFRITLSVVFCTLYLSNSKTYAFATFLIACITDILDGFIARKFNMITDIGKLLDPFADKFMILSVFVCFCIKNDISIWYFYILLFKELVFIVFGVCCLKKDIIVYSKNYGKLSSLLLNIGIISVLLSMDNLSNAFFITGIMCAAIGALQYALYFVDTNIFWRK